MNIPVLCPPTPPSDAPLQKHCTEGLLQSDPKVTLRDPVPGERGAWAGGPWFQLQEVVRGMPGIMPGASWLSLPHGKAKTQEGRSLWIFVGQSASPSQGQVSCA